MKRVIWKYPINLQGPTLVPADSKIVFFGPDPQARLCVWAEHVINEDRRPLPGHMILHVLGTGMEFEINGWKHVMSCVHENTWVWHLYVDAPRSENDE